MKMTPGPRGTYRIHAPLLRQLVGQCCKGKEELSVCVPKYPRCWPRGGDGGSEIRTAPLTKK